jgi:hypothetical protein
MTRSKLVQLQIVGAAALVLTGAYWAGTALAKPQSRADGSPQALSLCDWSAGQFGAPFLPWADANPYFPAPGGTFENGAAGWTLAGGAALATGNEPFFVNSRVDRHSLSIPNGASATSPAVCVNALSPTIRLFAINRGGADRPLSVVLNYTSTDGKPQSKKIADLKGGARWTPTLPIAFLKPITNILKRNGQTVVSFTFSVDVQKSDPASWQIDDLYVDPLKSG